MEVPLLHAELLVSSGRIRQPSSKPFSVKERRLSWQGPVPICSTWCRPRWRLRGSRHLVQKASSRPVAARCLATHWAISSIASWPLAAGVKHALMLELNAEDLLRTVTRNDGEEPLGLVSGFHTESIFDATYVDDDAMVFSSPDASQLLVAGCFAVAPPSSSSYCDSGQRVHQVPAESEFSRRQNRGFGLL